jgi:hypothetical protein
MQKFYWWYSFVLFFLLSLVFAVCRGSLKLSTDRCGTACMFIRGDHLLVDIRRCFLMMFCSFLLLWVLFGRLVPSCWEFSFLFFSFLFFLLLEWFAFIKISKYEGTNKGTGKKTSMDIYIKINIVQWLRLALSKGPNRVSPSPHLKTEKDTFSEALLSSI